MDKELTDWQQRLALHFAALRERRRVDGANRPIFGLEHGLSQSEVQALETAVRSHIVHRRPLRDHALAWIVYASELGYRYAGDEYWQTFERETPGWIANGDRNQLRTFYRQFHRDFGGAVPSGLWAEHFSIICWPITHAILPKDLQLQLARTLYELRHSFSGAILESPEALGEQIAARSWNATSRFQNFAQGTQLVSQIAAALLFEGEPGTSQLIYPGTLMRIREDLDRERQAREWLRSARQTANERTNVRGLNLFERNAGLSNLKRLDEARAAVAALGIEPRLVLRPTGSLGVSWDVLLEVPDLSHLLLRFPETREILTGSRCEVAGYSGRPLARGRLLHGAQRVMLSRWPRPDEVLLKFEKTDSRLEFLLLTECLLRAGPRWLFRIASDGLAYECRNLRVRPGERYILVSNAGPIMSDEHTTPIDLECAGVHALMLDLPHALTPDWEEAIRKLWIWQARTLEVWPAGLAPIAWDGEGYGEWSASEPPCIAIQADHSLESLRVSMDSDVNRTLEFTAVEPGEPVFIEFPQLSVGVHHLNVSARRTSTGQTEQLGGLEIAIRILEDRPRSPIVNPLGPLSVNMDPVVPTLDQLWEGQAELSIRGPDGRQVECIVSLFERADEGALIAERVPPINMPVTADVWHVHFREHFQKKRAAQEAYDRARVCTLDFSAQELGAFTIRFEREFTPLRWAVRRRGKSNLVRLFDDSGDSGRSGVSRAAFETPCVEEPLPFDSECQVHVSGGMYVARTERFVAAIIVPPVLTGLGLADLSLAPTIERRQRSIESIMSMVDMSGLWGQARLPGDLLSVIRQRNVMLALASELFRLLCGENWTRAENGVASNDSIRALKALSYAVDGQPTEAGVGPILLRDAETIAHDTCSDRVGLFASLAVQHGLIRPYPAPGRLRGASMNQQMSAGVDTPAWLAEFSLRLASDPAGIETWAGQHLRIGLDRLMQRPILAKAAKFLVIATEQYSPFGSVFGELYAGWRWG